MDCDTGSFCWQVLYGVPGVLPASARCRHVITQCGAWYSDATIGSLPSPAIYQVCRGADGVELGTGDRRNLIAPMVTDTGIEAWHPFSCSKLAIIAHGRLISQINFELFHAILEKTRKIKLGSAASSPVSGTIALNHIIPATAISPRQH